MYLELPGRILRLKLPHMAREKEEQGATRARARKKEGSGEVEVGDERRRGEGEKEGELYIHTPIHTQQHVCRMQYMAR